MSDYSRHKRIFRLFHPAMKLFARSKFNYSSDDLSMIPGPYLLLSNHNTDFDPVFIGLASGKHLYFVATENITRIPVVGKILLRWFDPIIHFKGKAGMKTVLSIISRIKDGHSVCMFAEGNRSFNGLTMPIPAVTGKLAKKTGASLVTFKLEGGYLSSPRWSVKTRKGRVRGKLVNIYSPELLKSMTDEEVYGAIVRDLHVDAYEDQKRFPVRYKGKRLAEGLESTLFMCPSCGKVAGLSTKGNFVSCSCGFHAVYDEYGMINTGDGNSYTVTQLDRWQRDVLKKMSGYPDEEVLFSDEVAFHEIDDSTHKAVRSWNGILSAGSHSLLLDGTQLPFSEISGLAVSTRNTLLLHYEKGARHIDIKGPVSFSALKYYYLYQFSTGDAEL